MIELIVQTLTNVCSSASVYILIGLGFGLVHRAGRFFHLAHGAVFTAGAYAGWLLHRAVQLPQWIAFPLAVPLATGIGLLLWLLVYRPIRMSGGGALALLIGGIGADLVLQNLLSLAFGDETLQIRSPFWEQTTTYFGAHASFAQVALVIAGLVGVLLTFAFRTRTRTGREIRAVGDSASLAATVGIDADKVLMNAFIFASALAGLGGLLSSLDTDMRPGMGLQPLLLGATASVVGGPGRELGLVAAALLFSFVQHGGTWFMAGNWALPVALGAMLLSLCLKPHGLWSDRRRVE